MVFSAVYRARWWLYLGIAVQVLALYLPDGPEWHRVNAWTHYAAVVLGGIVLLAPISVLPFAILLAGWRLVRESVLGRPILRAPSVSWAGARRAARVALALLVLEHLVLLVLTQLPWALSASARVWIASGLGILLFFALLDMVGSAYSAASKAIEAVNGWGPLRWGMTVSQAQEALTALPGVKIASWTPLQPDRWPSFEVELDGESLGVSTRSLQLAFPNERLASVAVVFCPMSAKSREIFAQALLTRYGKPSTDHPRWNLGGTSILLNSAEQFDYLVYSAPALEPKASAT